MHYIILGVQNLIMDILRNCYTTESSSSEDDDSREKHSEPTKTNSTCHACSKSLDSSVDHVSPSCTALGDKIHNAEKKVSENSPQLMESNQKDFFSLNDTDDSSGNEGDDTQNSLKTSGQDAIDEIISPNSDFWNHKGPEIVHWDDPSKIWKCQPNELTESKSGLLANYKRKRKHGKQSQVSPKLFKKEESNTNVTSGKAMSQSPFFIHHKIAPYLHQTVSNKSPRSPIAKGTEHCGCVNAVAWCTQPEYSHLLLSASHDKTIKLWNIFSKDGISCVQTIAAHDKGVRSVQWVNGTNNILSASFDKTARVIDVEKGS